MDFSIRPAKEDDIPGICDLLSELFSIEADFEPELVKQALGVAGFLLWPRMEEDQPYLHLRF